MRSLFTHAIQPSHDERCYNRIVISSFNRVIALLNIQLVSHGSVDWISHNTQRERSRHNANSRKVLHRRDRSPCTTMRLRWGRVASRLTSSPPLVCAEKDSVNVEEISTIQLTCVKFYTHEWSHLWNYGCDNKKNWIVNCTKCEFFSRIFHY